MRVRIAHKIKSNKRTYLPRKFIFFDTETYPIRVTKNIEIHKLKLGWACLWNRERSDRVETIKWFEFTKQSEFLDFIESNIYSKERLILVAHNFVYDFTMVKGWNEIIKKGWKLTRLYEKNHIFISRYKKSNKSILCLDNMNFFVSSLEKLGEEIGIKKLKINFKTCTKSELSIYCKQDVNILLQTWKKYLNWFIENDLGNFGVTISSQSFNSYRHRFMNSDIFIHNRKYVLNLERESYFGGRTECFKIGKFRDDKYYYLDINSMYPSVMIDNYYPTKLVKHNFEISLTELKLYLNRYSIVAKVLIDTDKPLFPVRGYKYKKRYKQNSLSYDFDVFGQVKKWVRDKGGVRPEYINVNGKIKVREEYSDIPSYYKSKNGLPADELASGLTYERLDLANLCKIDNLNYLPGDRLIHILKSKASENKDFWFDNSPEEVSEGYYSKKTDNTTTINKVIFPIGNFEAVLTSPELELGLKENVIKKVLSCCFYEKSKMFSSFIDFFYNERLKSKLIGNTTNSLFFKLIMNSLYGKFGQQMGEWETVGKCKSYKVDYWNEIIAKTGKIYKYRNINGLTQRYEKKRESFNSFPAISAHVTAYARVKLWRLIEKAKIENVYYCDTDSLFVNEQGYENLRSEINETELGKLKVEDMTNTLEIKGCKRYKFGSKVRHKGQRKDAVQIGINSFKQKQWSTLKSLIANRNLESYQVTDIIKTFSNNYDKGIVDNLGNVQPLVL